MGCAQAGQIWPRKSHFCLLNLCLKAALLHYLKGRGLLLVVVSFHYSAEMGNKGKKNNVQQSNPSNVKPFEYSFVPDSLNIFVCSIY